MSQSKLYPRDIDLEAGDKHKKFIQLTEETSSPFYGKTMKQVFMYALGLGFKNKKRLPIKKRTGIIPVRSLSDKDIAILKAVAICETKTIDTMFGENAQNIFKIAEEYANGGIELLYYQVFNPEPGDVDKRLEQPLREILNSLHQADQH
jgi:dnd system-associated protein 4